MGKGRSTHPCTFTLRAVGRQRYAVATSREVAVWEVDHDLDYNVLRGGHEKAVVAL